MQEASFLKRKIKHRCMKYVSKTYTHNLGGADGCSVAVLCRGVWGGKYILRGTEAGTEQGLVGTRKGRTSKTSVGQNFKEEIFQVWISEDVRDGQRIFQIKGGNMYNHISWYHSQHREKEKCPNAG